MFKFQSSLESRKLDKCIFFLTYLTNLVIYWQQNMLLHVLLLSSIQNMLPHSLPPDYGAFFVLLISFKNNCHNLFINTDVLIAHKIYDII